MMDPRMMYSLMMGPGGTMGHWGMGGPMGGTMGPWGPMDLCQGRHHLILRGHGDRREQWRAQIQHCQRPPCLCWPAAWALRRSTATSWMSRWTGSRWRTWPASGRSSAWGSRLWDSTWRTWSWASSSSWRRTRNSSSTRSRTWPRFLEITWPVPTTNMPPTATTPSTSGAERSFNGWGKRKWEMGKNLCSSIELSFTFYSGFCPNWRGQDSLYSLQIHLRKIPFDTFSLQNKSPRSRVWPSNFSNDFEDFFQDLFFSHVFGHLDVEGILLLTAGRLKLLKQLAQVVLEAIV